MSKVHERVNYLKTHLYYELTMFRHTLAQLNIIKDPTSWNVHFESFTLHARALRDFLTGDGDSRNFSVRDYGVKPAKKNHIGTFQKMNQQVLHMGKQRFDDPNKKITTGDLMKVGSWIEDSLAEFGKALQDPYVAAWNPRDSLPTSLYIAAGVPSASSQPHSMSVKPIGEPS